MLASLDSIRKSSLTEDELIFDSGSIGFFKWILLIALACILDGVWFYTTRNALVVLPLIVVIVSLVLWNIVGRFLTGNVVLPRFQQWQDEMNADSSTSQIRAGSPTLQYMKALFYRVLGLHLSLDKKYYVEAHIPTPDALSIRNVFRERLFDLISACMGIGFLLAALLQPFFVDVYEDDPESLLLALELLVVISPILVCWLIPVIWTLKDSQIKSLDPNQIIRDQAESVGSSGVSRFLGLAGIVAGFTYLLDLAPSFTEEETLAIYQWTIVTFAQLLFMVMGTALLLTAAYLRLFHSSNVNRFRRRLAATLSLNVALARSITPEESNLFEKAQAEYPKTGRSPDNNRIDSQENVVTEQRQLTPPPLPEPPQPRDRKPTFCIKCGTRLSSSAKFCITCGEPISQPQAFPCNRCGQEVSPSAKFCKVCGEPVRQYRQEQRPLPRPPSSLPLVSLGRIIFGGLVLYIGLMLLFTAIGSLVVNVVIFFFPADVKWEFSTTTLLFTGAIGLAICMLGLKLEYGVFTPFKDRTHHLWFAPKTEKLVQTLRISTFTKALLFIYIFMLGYATFTAIYTFWVDGGDLSQFMSLLAFSSASLLIGIKWYATLAMGDANIENVVNRKAQLERSPEDRAIDRGAETLYHGKKPSFVKWLVIIGVAILLQSIFYGGAIAVGLTIGEDPADYDDQLVGVAIRLTAMSLVATVLSIFMWRIVSALVMNRVIIGNLNLWKKEHAMKQGLTPEKMGRKTGLRIGIISRLFLRALNFKIDPHKQYYLEAIGKDSDFSSIRKNFSDKVIELTSACLGVGFLLATALKPLFLTYGVLEESDFLFLVIVLILFSPVFVSWLMPVIWLLEDCQIRSIDEDRNIGDLSEDVRGSRLSQFLGLAGFAAGINYFIDIVPELHPDLIENYADELWFAISYTLDFALLLIGSAFLIGMVYLALFHEKQVNKYRQELAQSLALGVTILREANDSERACVEA
ncbi:MAG: zinc ribbon domain-containing protein [Candidatus Heimdallarchaeota archaeon]